MFESVNRPTDAGTPGQFHNDTINYEIIIHFNPKISSFSGEGETLVLIAQVPGHHLTFNFSVIFIIVLYMLKDFK